MEVFIRDEDKKYAVVDKSQFEPYSFLLESYDKIKVKSLDQHDAEVRADERKKWQEIRGVGKISFHNSELKDDEEDSPTIIDIEILQQKLNELKGE